jgi:hypothetical protein
LLSEEKQLPGAGIVAPQQGCAAQRKVSFTLDPRRTPGNPQGISETFI